MSPYWTIYCTLGKFSKPVAIIILPKLLTFLGNFCKGVKIINFSREICFGQLIETFGDFLLVALPTTSRSLPEFHFGRRVWPREAFEEVAGVASDLRRAHVERVVEAGSSGT